MRKLELVIGIQSLRGNVHFVTKHGGGINILGLIFRLKFKCSILIMEVGFCQT